MPGPYLRDLILKVWGGDPLWPCQPARSSSGSCFHHSPPKCGWSVPDDETDLSWFNQERTPAGVDSSIYDQSPAWQPTEISLGDGLTMVLDEASKEAVNRRK